MDGGAALQRPVRVGAGTPWKVSAGAVSAPRRAGRTRPVPARRAEEGATEARPGCYARGMERAEGRVTDAALIAAITDVGGAPWAETELCRRYERRVFLYGLKHTRDREAAADLVQEVMAMVLQKVRARKVEQSERFGSFVLGTCRMLVVNHRRKEQRRGKILAQYRDPRDSTPGEVESTAADRARLQACLERLSDRERNVVLLSFYAELDASAIALETALSAANVRVIRHRALERLHTCMQASAAEGGGA